MANDKPMTLEQQIDMMKKYVSFTKRARMRAFVEYTGYFRASRYGKYLLSYSNIFSMKPSQQNLFDIYKFDFELRKIMFEACMKAEIQIKSNIANAVSLKTGDATFYLDKINYTPSGGEKNKVDKQKNITFFNKFIQRLNKSETELRNDLKKEVLRYGYSRGKYGKITTIHMDTWINGVRILRNICAHSSKLVGMQEAIVLPDIEDDADILISREDLFSRLYALKKILKPQDSEGMKIEIQKLLKRTKVNVYQLNILPIDWEDRFDRIKYL
mgnify:CR=1 FL=1